MIVLALVAALGAPAAVATAGSAPPPGPLEYTGRLADELPAADYPVVLQAGDEIRVSAVATSGDLDPYLVLADPSGAVVSENDDVDGTTLDSSIAFTGTVAGEYVVTVSNVAGTAGTYLLAIELGPTPVAGDTLEYVGALSDELADARYPFSLEAGQGVRITADRVSGDLDPIIAIVDARGESIVVNDDRDTDAGDLNSELGCVSPTSASYTLVVGHVSPTSGEYRAVVYVVDPAEVGTVGRVSLSGPPLALDTTNFLVHYTAEGEDTTTGDFAELVGTTMEDVLQIQTGLDWPLPPPDGAMGGDDRYDVYLADVITDDPDDEGELGHTWWEPPGRDNPNTAAVEELAVPSHLVLDNDFGQDEIEPGEDGIAVMRASAAHEFHHAIEFGYDSSDPSQWYYEATASWMETVTYPEFQDATGYVEGLFQYPELCLGVHGDADPTDGMQQYGEWLFLQSLVDAHDEQGVLRLWEEIAHADGWIPLDSVLASYGDTRVDAVRRFRLQNLVRDYAWTPEFDSSTVWRDKTIDAPGQWTHDGNGVQPLGANYYGVNLIPGS